MQKPLIKETINELLELREDNFPSSVEFAELKNVFEKMQFGEILIKVVDGNIEMIQVTNYYKPLVIDNEDNMMYNEEDELTNNK